MEDVLARHNLFKNHDDMSLYDGHVRPDLFTRFPIFDENYKRRNNITSEFNGVYYECQGVDNKAMRIYFIAHF